MPGDELTGPVGYSAWWAVLGVVLILLAIGWVVGVLWRTRRTAAERNDTQQLQPQLGPQRTDPFAALRAEYDRRLDAVEQRYRGGELDERALHLTLSHEVRGFATGRLGVDASVLTLSEIEQLSGTKRLAKLIARYYRPSFAEYEVEPEARQTGADSIDRARSVVRSW